MPNYITPVARLTPTPRGKGGLNPAADRASIPASASEAVPEVEGQASTGTGIASPLTQQTHPGTATVFSLTSTDGLTVFEYWSQSEYLDDNAATVRFDHIAAP